MEKVNFSEIDKANLFYPLITTFFLSFHGILEFSTRKLILDLQNTGNFNKAIDENPINLPAELKQSLKDFKGFTPMIFSVEAIKKTSESSYYFDLEKSLREFDCIKEVTSNINRLAEILIIGSYEILQTYKPESNEVLEFFRHIRNAAAHNGKFHFIKNVLNKDTTELKEVAKWRNFEIKSNLQNYKLFNVLKNGNDNFWEYGDLIEFLLDLENYFPQIKKAEND